MNQKEIKVCAMQLPASFTDVLKMYCSIAGFGREGRVFGTKTQIPSLHFVNKTYQRFT